MGMFDSVWVDCPFCGNEKALEFQSKSGECLLMNYTLENVPSEVLRGIHPYPSKCKKCSQSFRLKTEEKTIVVGYFATLVPEGVYGKL